MIINCISTTKKDDLVSVLGSYESIMFLQMIEVNSCSWAFILSMKSAKICSNCLK